MKTLEDLALKWSEKFDLSPGARFVGALRELQHQHEAELSAVRARLDEATEIMRGAYSEVSPGTRREINAFLASVRPGEVDDQRRNDICARPKCLSPRCYNIHSVERGGHEFVETLPCGHGQVRSGPFCNDPTGLCEQAAFGPRRTIPKDASPVRPPAEPPAEAGMAAVERESIAIREELKPRLVAIQGPAEPRRAAHAFRSPFYGDASKCEVCGLPPGGHP